MSDYIKVLHFRTRIDGNKYIAECIELKKIKVEGPNIHSLIPKITNEVKKWIDKEITVAFMFDFKVTK